MIQTGLDKAGYEYLVIDGNAVDIRHLNTSGSRDNTVPRLLQMVGQSLTGAKMAKL